MHPLDYAALIILGSSLLALPVFAFIFRGNCLIVKYKIVTFVSQKTHKRNTNKKIITIGYL